MSYGMLRNQLEGRHAERAAAQRAHTAATLPELSLTLPVKLGGGAKSRNTLEATARRPQGARASRR